MTRREHFAEAEAALRLAQSSTNLLTAKVLLAAASVHALLATADVQVAP